MRNSNLAQVNLIAEEYPHLRDRALAGSSGRRLASAGLVQNNVDTVFPLALNCECLRLPGAIRWHNPFEAQ